MTAKSTFGGLQGINLGEGPFTHAFEITAHDENEFPYVTRAVYVGGTGNLTLVMVSGDEVSFSAVPSGTVLNLQVKQVKSTGLTASALVGLY